MGRSRHPSDCGGRGESSERGWETKPCARPHGIGSVSGGGTRAFRRAAHPRACRRRPPHRKTVMMERVSVRTARGSRGAARYQAKTRGVKTAPAARPSSAMTRSREGSM